MQDFYGKIMQVKDRAQKNLIFTATINSESLLATNCYLVKERKDSGSLGYEISAIESKATRTVRAMSR